MKMLSNQLKLLFPFFFMLTEAQKKGLWYPSPISFLLSVTCRKVGEWTPHFPIILLQVQNWEIYVCSAVKLTPVCTPSMLLLSVLLGDLAFRSIGHLPLPWCSAWEKPWEMPWVLSLSSQHPSPAGQDSCTAQPHPACGNRKVFCAVLSECSGCL